MRPLHLPGTRCFVLLLPLFLFVLFHTLRHPSTLPHTTPSHAAAPVQVVLVSASLRPGALQSAQAWVDTSPLNIRSEAPWAATPASRAAAAAQAAAAQAAAGGLGAGGASVSDVDGDKHLSSSDASRQQQGGDGGDGGVQQESTGTEAETARQRWAKMLPDTISHQVGGCVTNRVRRMLKE